MAISQSAESNPFCLCFKQTLHFFNVGIPARLWFFTDEAQNRPRVELEMRSIGEDCDIEAGRAIQLT